MSIAKCIVRLQDSHGVRHEATVYAVVRGLPHDHLATVNGGAVILPWVEEADAYAAE
jgi:hypothetical protein